MVSQSAYQVSRLTACIFATLAFLLLALNAMLTRQVSALKSGAARTRGEYEIKPGQSLPPLSGFGSNGSEITVSYSPEEVKTLLLIFSPSCAFCKENLPAWESIIRQRDTKTFRVYAISLKPEGVQEYLSTFDRLGVPLIIEPSPKDRVAYGLNLTPQTILVGPGGVAEKVWTGPLAASDKQELAEMLRSSVR